MLAGVSGAGGWRLLAPDDPLQFRLRLGEADAGPETREGPPRVSRDHIPAIAVGPRRVDIEPARHDADDDVSPSGREAGQLLADHIRIAAENTLPHPVADHDGLGGVSLNDDFVGLKPPADQRLHTQQRQRVEVHLLQQHALGSARTGHREVGLAHEGVSHAGDRLAFLPPGVGDVERDASRAPFAVDRLGPHESVRDREMGAGRARRRSAR